MDLSGCTHVINKLSECIQCEGTEECKLKNNQAQYKGIIITLLYRMCLNIKFGNSNIIYNSI